MAELRDWHGVCLTMSMGKRFARLFTIKTRFDAYLVIFAIAMGAVERGRHYLEIYPGNLGWVFAALATGVVFVAGAKLLDSVRPPETKPMVARIAQPRRRISRNRPRQSPRHSAVGSRVSRRKD